MSAERIAAVLADMDGPVEVVGRSALAEQVRGLLGTRLQDVGDPPRAVVETTGEPAALVAALRRVATLGTVVVAGPQPTTPPALDLYVDVHLRSLVVVGVPHPAALAAR